jgi:hypothetical protein
VVAFGGVSDFVRGMALLGKTIGGDLSIAAEIAGL